MFLFWGNLWRSEGKELWLLRQVGPESGDLLVLSIPVSIVNVIFETVKLLSIFSGHETSPGQQQLASFGKICVVTRSRWRERAQTSYSDVKFEQANIKAPWSRFHMGSDSHAQGKHTTLQTYVYIQ